MSIFQLVCFVTLVRMSTFHEASEKLYISQSAFSNHIKSLEKELGVELISRGSHTLSLTDAGRAFLNCAESIVVEYERMNGLIQQHKREVVNRVFIFTDPLSSYGYNYLLVQFSLHRPQIQTEVAELMDKSFISVMETRNDAVGIVFSKEMTAAPGTRSHTLVCDSLAAFVSESHHLAKREILQLHELRDEKLQIITRSPTLFLTNFVREQCQKAGFVPKIMPYDLWYTSMMETVREQRLIALIPERAARLFVQDDMRVISITDADPFYINVVISENCTHRAALQFFEFAKSVKNTLTSE